MARRLGLAPAARQAQLQLHRQLEVQELLALSASGLEPLLMMGPWKAA